MGMTLEECIEKIAELTEDRSRLVKNRHKHADVIIAWANGEAIEYKNLPDGRWYEIKYPHWDDETEYRIKPKEPKRLANENFMALFREYAFANLSNQKDYQDGWFTSEMEIALDVAGNFYAWLEKQHE